MLCTPYGLSNDPVRLMPCYRVIGSGYRRRTYITPRYELNLAVDFVIYPRRTKTKYPVRQSIMHTSTYRGGVNQESDRIAMYVCTTMHSELCTYKYVVHWPSPRSTPASSKHRVESSGTYGISQEVVRAWTLVCTGGGPSAFQLFSCPCCAEP